MAVSVPTAMAHHGMAPTLSRYLVDWRVAPKMRASADIATVRRWTACIYDNVARMPAADNGMPVLQQTANKNAGVDCCVLPVQAVTAMDSDATKPTISAISPISASPNGHFIRTRHCVRGWIRYSSLNVRLGIIPLGAIVGHRPPNPDAALH